MHGVVREPGVPRRRELSGVRIECCDLTDPGAVAELVARVAPEHCIHCAWITTPGEYLHVTRERRPRGRGRGARQCPRRSRVLAARRSRNLFRYAPSDAPLAESSPLSPRRRTHAQRWRPWNDWRVSARARRRRSPGRDSYLYGPTRTRAARPGRDARAARRPGAPTTGGEQLRDFLHVDDVARALVAVARSDVTGAVNMGRGTPSPCGKSSRRSAASPAGATSSRSARSPTPGRSDGRHRRCRKGRSLRIHPDADLEEGLARRSLVVRACAQREIRRSVRCPRARNRDVLPERAQQSALPQQGVADPVVCRRTPLRTAPAALEAIAAADRRVKVLGAVSTSGPCRNFRTVWNRDRRVVHVVGGRRLDRPGLRRGLRRRTRRASRLRPGRWSRPLTPGGTVRVLRAAGEAPVADPHGPGFWVQALGGSRQPVLWRDAARPGLFETPMPWA